MAYKALCSLINFIALITLCSIKYLLVITKPLGLNYLYCSLYKYVYLYLPLLYSFKEL
jgi:hypothetical protein